MMPTSESLVAGRDRGAQATLTRDLRRELKRGHPWVFSDAVRLPPGLEPGEIVSVLGGGGRDKRPIGKAYVDPEGALALRMCQIEDGARGRSDDGWARERLTAALALRERLFAGGATTGYRLVNGEGDGLPGLVVDRYGEALVVKTDGPVAHRFWSTQAIAHHLVRLTSARLVYGRTRARGGPEGMPLVGPTPTEPVPFVEHGARFVADIVSGQKTGFFFDQRENRVRVGLLAAGRHVLNAFGYTGGFSVHAGLGGAAHVTTLDLARPAIDAAQTNWRLNGLLDERHEGLVGDTFELLEATERRWDLVVLDPPAFAPSKQKLPQALAAYRRLAAAGARVARPNTILVIASCSAHVTMSDLKSAVEDGIGQSRRRATMLHACGQPPDHPSPLACPELAYLKALYLVVA